MKRATLCIPITDTAILLGKKKIRFGAGKWNGFGGKIKEHETPEQAAVREPQEESGLSTDINSLEKVAVLLFYFNRIPTFLVHTYTTKTWTGIPKESGEMTPQWHARTNIPYDDMWQADRMWLKEILGGKKIAAHIYFTTEGIPSKDLEEFDRIEYDEALWNEV